MRRGERAGGPAVSDSVMRTDERGRHRDRLTVRALVSLPGSDAPIPAHQFPESALRRGRYRLHAVVLPSGDQLTLVEIVDWRPWR